MIEEIKPVRLNKDGTPRKVHIYVAETLDTYFGKDSSIDLCNQLALQVMSKPMAKLETELNQSKWFDYRTVHPTHLCYLWAFYYREAYKRFLTTYRTEDGMYMNGLAGKDVFALIQGKGENKGREFANPASKAVWRARQKADQLGVPYDFYIRAVMNHAESTSWARPPRPQHLYSDDMVAAVVDAWKVKLDTQIITAEHERFLASNYSGNCDQRDYQVWLINAIKKRPHKEFGIHYCMVEKKQLHEIMATKVFGKGLIDKAKLIVLM